MAGKTSGNGRKVGQAKPIILVSFGVVLLFLISMFFISTFLDERAERESDQRNALNAVENLYKEQLRTDAAMMDGALDAVSRDRDIKAAFLARDRDGLERLTRPLFESLNRKYAITHFYFVGPDRVAFLRAHKPDRHGDTIGRFTMREAQRTGAFASGVELGPLGTLTLRTVVPWRDGERLIGYLEMGKEIEGVVDDIRDFLGVDMALLLDKTFLDRDGWAAGVAMLGRAGRWDRYPTAVVAAQTMAEAPAAVSEAMGAGRHRPGGTAEVEAAGRSYRLSFLPFLDVSGTRLGEFVVIQDVTSRAASFRHTMLLAIGPSIVAGIVLFALFSVLLGRIERRLRAAYDSLSDEIAERRRAEAELRKSEARFRSLVDVSPDAILIQGRDGITFVNPAMAALLGGETGPAGLMGCDFRTFVRPDHGCHVGALIDQVVDGKESDPRFRECLVKTPDGRSVTVELAVLPVEVAGTPSAQLIVHDLSARREAERYQRMASIVFEASADAMMAVDADQRIEMVNPAFTAITGYAPEEVLGRDPRVLSSGHHPEDFFQDMFQALRSGGCWRGDIWNRRKNGEIYVQRLTISAIKDANGEIAKFVSIFSDITEEKLREELVLKRANMDALTGLPNRYLLKAQLSHAVSNKRKPSNGLAVLFLDLDGFKPVNDTYGHLAGDLVLRQVSERLRGCVRDDDTVARLGGDEFVVVVRNIEGRDNVEVVARKVLASFTRRFEIDGGAVDVGCSIGIATYPDGGEDPETLLENADKAMYEAKRAGKGGYRFFAPDSFADGGDGSVSGCKLVEV